MSLWLSSWSHTSQWSKQLRVVYLRCQKEAECLQLQWEWCKQIQIGWYFHSRMQECITKIVIPISMCHMCLNLKLQTLSSKCTDENLSNNCPLSSVLKGFLTRFRVVSQLLFTLAAIVIPNTVSQVVFPPKLHHQFDLFLFPSCFSSCGWKTQVATFSWTLKGFLFIQSKSFTAWLTTVVAIANDDVHAGEGALRTLSTTPEPPFSNRKFPIIFPESSIATACTPAHPWVVCATFKLGQYL